VVILYSIAFLFYDDRRRRIRSGDSAYDAIRSRAE
jgi:hypothetical protein